MLNVLHQDSGLLLQTDRTKPSKPFSTHFFKPLAHSRANYALSKSARQRIHGDKPFQTQIFIFAFVILTVCEVLNVEVNRYSRRPYVKALCQQGGYLFTAIWFNQPYVAAKLGRAEYLFYGRVQNKYGMGCQMVNPSFERMTE